MRFENSELRAFRAVIEEGGFRRAAEALHLSQSAVSQAVAGLEFKLGAPLVVRGKELRLTDVGKRLFEHAVDVLRGEQQAMEDIEQLKQGKTGTLSLALSASLNRFYAPTLISAYYQENPHTRLKVAEMPSAASSPPCSRATWNWGWGHSRKTWSRLKPFRCIATHATW